ncbi:Xaa-Pro peptidase family protein [Mesorhizobium sp.]|uniref:M24 family metallopeptidase n=1 Tax=Mesorhizobium sp. TaxID=1871066 RepID=UPI0025EEF321|nr:Xaa-Pro peptidase family protein [Mesorhizobium sp.]
MRNTQSSFGPGLPFSQAEYDRRWQAVLDRFQEFGVDAVISTFSRNHQYLTAHAASGSYARPYYLIIAPDVPRTNIVRLYDEWDVRAQSIPLEIHTYHQLADAGKVCAEVMRSLGLDRGRVGMELDLFGMTARDVMELQELLPNIEVVDVSRLILTVADIKSADEIAVMRKAMEGTEAGVAAFVDALKEGVSELETATIVQAAVESTGVEAQSFSLLFGDRTAVGHAKPSNNRLKQGDVAYIEVGGKLHDYAAGLVRSAIYGRHAEAEALYELSNAALEAAIAAAKPGALTGDVDAAARQVVERAGRPHTFRQRVGYSCGLGWSTRGYTSLEPGGQNVLRPNMTLHMPLFLTNEEGRFAIGCSETILVTDGEAEVLSKGDRDLPFRSNS